MGWLENLLIIGGISLDIFAAMECQGSVVANIEKKGLAVICALVCVWQIACFSLGRALLVFLIYGGRASENGQFIGNGIAVIIYAGLGFHFFLKAVRNDKIKESREDGFHIKRILQGMAGTGVYTLLAGIAFGFAGIQRTFCLLVIVFFSITAAVAGAYTGYHFGFLQRKRAYGAGALLLWAAGGILIYRLL